MPVLWCAGQGKFTGVVRSWTQGAQQGRVAGGASRCLWRYGRRLIQSVQSAAQGGPWLQQELSQGMLMVVLVGRAVKPGISCHVLPLGRGVPEDAIDELLNGQGHGPGSMVAVIGVLESHGFTVEQ